MKLITQNSFLKMLAKPFGMLALAFNANAQLNTFIGSGNWGNGANWSTGGVPTASNYVVIPDGSICTVDITNAVCKCSQ